MGVLHRLPGMQAMPVGFPASAARYSQKIRRTFGANLTYHYPLDEESGPAAIEASGQTYNAQVLQNGSFEVAGGGGADVFAGWGESSGISDETASVHTGGHACKITTTTGTENAQQNFTVAPGETLTVSFCTRGDGSNAGRWALYDVTNAAWIQPLTGTGVSGTSYTEVTDSFTVPAGCVQARFYCYAAPGAGAEVYFDDVKVKRPQKLDGTYAASGITYGEVGIGDGRTSTKYSGANTHVDLGYPKFNSVWNGNKGTVLAWGKVDGASRWTDASTYRYVWHPKSTNEPTVYMVMGKTSTNHQLTWRRRVAGSIYESLYTFSPSGTLGWFCMGMTWDVTAGTPFINTYLYTREEATWQIVGQDEPSVGTENWDNDVYPVEGGQHVLMAGSTSAQEWIGWGAHVVYGAGVVLSDAQMRRVMTL